MYFNGTKCCLLIFCSLLSLSVNAKNAKTSAEGQGLRKPLCFVENSGQIIGLDNNKRSDIQFKLSTPGMNLYIGNAQLHYQFQKNTGTPSELNISGYELDVTLVGANPDAKAIPCDKNNYYENYYTAQAGPDGFTAHSYNKVVYTDVYPGIDWVLYTKGGKVEYDFIVHPGADPSAIKLKYGGATSLNLTNEGGVSAKTPLGYVEEKKPYAFETLSGKAVAANFVLNGDVVSFQTGSYNGTLTIDPFILWSTYLGGTLEDVARSVKVDNTGNTFVGGYTKSTAGISFGAGIFQPAHIGAGTYDAFVAKYDNTGVLVWSTYFGNTQNDQGLAIAVSATGASVYVVGVTGSNTGMATAGTYHAFFGGAPGTTDGFLAKFDNVGNRTWCTYYGGPGNDAANALTLDNADTIYITGQTASATLVSSGSAYQTTLNGASDAFVAKFNPANGTNLWSTYYGGSAQEAGYGITLDVARNVYITGQTNSITGIASAGAYQAVLSGTNDGFIAKFTNYVNIFGVRTCARSWGTYLGGTGSEQGNAIAYDPALQGLAIVGNTTSIIGLATPNSFQPVYGGSTQDAFLAYGDTSGRFKWITNYGGASLDYGQDVCFDRFSNSMMCGGSFSANNIASAGSYQSVIAGDYDAYVAKFNTLGQRLWGTYFGGPFYDYANSITYDPNSDRVTIAGYTTSLSGIAGPTAAQPAFAGGIYDAFIAKFDIDTFVTINQRYTDTLVCLGGTLKVYYTVYPTGSGAFQPGNVFSVEMSDNTGVFGSPTAIGIIGTSSATGSGFVTCTVPAGMTPDFGYRIRIIASDPGFTSPDDYYDIHVTAGPLPPMIASSNTPVCVGSPVFLRDSTSYTISSYTWYGPSGFFSVVPNPIILSATLANAGTYSVTAVHNGCPPLAMVTTDVVINDFVAPTPWDSASIACDGRTLYLFSDPDTTAPLSDIRFVWSGPAGFTSSLQNPVLPTVSSANTGDYFVYDTVEGCRSLANTIHVTVIAINPVGILVTVSPNDTVCGGTMVNFAATTYFGGSAPLLQWYSVPASPIVGATSPIFSSSSLTDGEGIYCKLTSDIICSSAPVATSNTITMNVITNPPRVHIAPSPGLYVPSGSPVTFTASVYNGGVGPIYHWYLNNVLIPGATSDVFTVPSVTNADTVSLSVISTMLCAVPDSGVSNTVIITTNVGVANIPSTLNNIALYPNPNTGTFTIKGDMAELNSEAVSFEITNMLGQVIQTGEAGVHNNEINKTIDLGNVPPGVYMIRINEDGETKILRFSVQH